MIGPKTCIVYIRYVIRHKWHVARLCFKYGLYWRGLTHDLSKFLPSELFPYLRFAPYRSKVKEDRKYPVPDHILRPYRKAVWLHKHRNDHHPEYWTGDMSEQAIIEMIFDWQSVGLVHEKSKKGATDLYRQRGLKMPLTAKTRARLEQLLRTLDLS